MFVHIPISYPSQTFFSHRQRRKALPENFRYFTRDVDKIALRLRGVLLRPKYTINSVLFTINDHRGQNKNQSILSRHLGTWLPYPPQTSARNPLKTKPLLRPRGSSFGASALASAAALQGRLFICGPSVHSLIHSLVHSSIHWSTLTHNHIHMYKASTRPFQIEAFPFRRSVGGTDTSPQ